MWETRDQIQTRAQVTADPTIARAHNIIDTLDARERTGDAAWSLDNRDADAIVRVIDGVTTVQKPTGNCALCQEELWDEGAPKGTEGCECAWRLSCGHTFHKRCPGGNTIAAWLARKFECPVCRRKMANRVG